MALLTILSVQSGCSLRAGLRRCSMASTSCCRRRKRSLLKSAYPGCCFSGLPRHLLLSAKLRRNFIASVKASDVLRPTAITTGTRSTTTSRTDKHTQNETRTGICYPNGSNLVFTIKRPADSSFSTFNVTLTSLSISSSSYFVFGTINKDCTKVAIYCYASNAYRVKIYNIKANNTLTFVRETASYPCTPARMCWSGMSNNTIVVRASNYTGASLYRIRSIDVATGNVVQSSSPELNLTLITTPNGPPKPQADAS